MNTTRGATVAATSSVRQKDKKKNNKNSGNTGKEYHGKRFTGANSSLTGKIFDVTGRDAIHQFADTLKAIADYVGQQYTHGGYMHFMIENLSDFNFVRPPNPADPDDPYEMDSWKKQLDIHWKRRGIYADNKMKLYSLVWG